MALMKNGGDRGVGRGRGTSAPSSRRPSTRPSASGLTRPSAPGEILPPTPKVTRPSTPRETLPHASKVPLPSAPRETLPPTPKVPRPLAPGETRPSAKGVTRQSSHAGTRSSVPRVTRPSVQGVTQPSPTRMTSAPSVPPPTSPDALRPATMVAHTSPLPSFRHPHHIVTMHHSADVSPHENDISGDASNDPTIYVPNDESVDVPLGLSNDSPRNSPLVKIHGRTPEEFARSQLFEVSIVRDVNETRLYPTTVASYLRNVFRLKHEFDKLLAIKWELVPESTKDFYLGRWQKFTNGGQ